MSTDQESPVVGFRSKQGSQHYLPQFYLRAWGRKRGKTYQVSVYDLGECRSFRTSTKNICQEKAFYNVTLPSGQVFSLDPDVRNIESIVAPSITKLRRDQSLKGLSDEDRQNIATFCGLIGLGVLGFRETLSEFIAGLFGSLTPPLDDNHLKALANRTLAEELQKHIAIYYSMRWVLWRPPSGSAFHTSDNPLVKHKPDHFVRGFYDRGLGLLSRGIQLQLPVSCDLALLMFHPEDYPKFHDESIRYIPDNLLHLTMLHFTDLLAHNASRYLISRDPTIEHLLPDMRRSERRVYFAP